jgi:Galactose-3-O-sulfotransferase
MGTTVKSHKHPPILFLHNLKAGGTTFRDVLSRQYGPSRVYTVRGRIERLEAPKSDGLKRLPALDLSEVRVIQGHIPFGVHRLLPAESTYVTLLRDPIARTVSLYRFLRQGRLTRLRVTVGPHLASLERFVEAGGVLEVDNGQTRRLSGLSPSFGRCTPSMLELAKRHVRERFSVVGLTERFDDSVILCKRRFGWRAVTYLKSNVTKGAPAAELIPGAARRAIERYNELDLELYAYAEDLLREAIRGQGPEFEAEVRALQLLNRACASRLGLADRRAGSGAAPAEGIGLAVDGRPDLGATLLDAHAQLLRHEAALRKELGRLRDREREREKRARWLHRLLARAPWRFPTRASTTETLIGSAYVTLGGILSACA